MTPDEATKALFNMVRKNNAAGVQDALEAGASVDAIEDDKEYTPLHWAVVRCRADMVKALIEAGASADVKNNRGETPLHMAGWRGDADMVKALLEAGANINEPDDTKRTPLHWAGDYGNADMVKALLEAGASVYALNDEGKTPSQEAMKRGHKELSEFLDNWSKGVTTQIVGIHTAPPQTDASPNLTGTFAFDVARGDIQPRSRE